MLWPDYPRKNLLDTITQPGDEPEATPPRRAGAALKWLRHLHAELKRDNVFKGAAALPYYLTLAIFLAMIFVMAVIPYLPIAHVDQAILDLLSQTLPPSAVQMFSGVVRDVTSERKGGCFRSACSEPYGRRRRACTRSCNR